MTRQSGAKTKTGKQTPRIDIYVKGSTERAKLLFELLDEYGINLLPWQRLVLLRWLAEDEKGNFINLDCGLSVPRQNGKTEILVARIIYGIIFRKSTGLFTAQQQKTADIVKRRVQDFFYNNHHEEIFNLLTARFRKKPRNYNFMEFENGAYYSFSTRTRLGDLGNTNDDLICDEAAEMMDSHQESLLPTISAAKSGNPQVIYCGTPPTAESVGEVFSRKRKEIMSGAKGCWTEWSVEALSERSDEAKWYETNPSLGIFLLENAVENEAHSLSVDGFNRMRLGWWSGIEDKRAITSHVWDSLANERPDFDDGFKPVYAVKFAPDRSAASLAVAQPLKDGRVHVEIVISRPMSEGFARLSKWIIERGKHCAKIVIDGATGQAILFEDLTSGGVPAKKIVQPNMKEVVAAHQFTWDALTRSELSHFNQPLLNQTIRITKLRQFGRYGGFGWESMSKNLSTSALDAATFAFWGQKVFSKRSKTTEDKKMSAKRWHEVLSQL
jgi:hypothetical protein